MEPPGPRAGPGPPPAPHGPAPALRGLRRSSQPREPQKPREKLREKLWKLREQPQKPREKLQEQPREKLQEKTREKPREEPTKPREQPRDSPREQRRKEPKRPRVQPQEEPWEQPREEPQKLRESPREQRQEQPQKPRDCPREQPREWRASRPGRSRVPGRDHRRYYHERWRSEYLMEFNAARHGMRCLVCGSALATLKLSTIKRHIRQKHPYSGAWGPREKQQVLRSWAARPGPPPPPAPERAPGSARGTGPPSPRATKVSPGGVAVARGPAGDSLRGWLRAELLLDLEAGGHRLRCLLCACPLPSLHLGDIRRHALAAHPDTLRGQRGHPGDSPAPPPPGPTEEEEEEKEEEEEAAGGVGGTGAPPA